MKKHLMSILVVLTVLAMAWPALGQAEGSSDQPRREGREGGRVLQNLSPEERTRLIEAMTTITVQSLFRL